MRTLQSFTLRSLYPAEALDSSLDMKCPAGHVQTVAYYPDTELPRLYIRMGLKCTK